jgi:MFS family permease
MQATRTSAGGRLFRLLIGALILVSAAAQFAVVPVMPVYARRLGLSGFEQGMVLGATGLATLVVAVPAGTLSDRFGARRITLAAGLLMAAATAAQALAGDFPALLAARLAMLRVPPGPAAPYQASTPGLTAVPGNRNLIGAAAAVVTAGLSTGVCALLVPARLHAYGVSPGQTGLAFAAAGILFAVGSALTAMVGRRAVNLPVTCGAMLVQAAALSLAVVGTTPLPLVAMLCVTTAARSVLWTISYPLAASGAASTGLGASVGLLNVIWAATAVLGPFGAGAAAEHLGASAAFGLTQAACAAALAVTAVLTWRPARAAPDSSPTPRRGRTRSPSARPS